MGAAMTGLENVVVLKGDSFTERELAITKPVDDYVPTGLIGAIAEMNSGIDYKGLQLNNPTSFCIGATIDLGRGLDRQVALTRKKVEAGAQFFLLQALFSPERLTEFLERYAERYGDELAALVCCGVQVLVEDGITFGDLPDWVTRPSARAVRVRMSPLRWRAGISTPGTGRCICLPLSTGADDATTPPASGSSNGCEGCKLCLIISGCVVYDIVTMRR